MTEESASVSRRTAIKGTATAAAAGAVGLGALAYTPGGAVAESEIEAGKVELENVGGTIEEVTIEPEILTAIGGLEEDEYGAQESETEIVYLEFAQQTGDEETKTYEKSDGSDEEDDDPTHIEFGQGSRVRQGESAEEDAEADIVFDWSQQGEIDLLTAEEQIEDGGVSEEEMDAEFLEPDDWEEERRTEIEVDLETRVSDPDGEDVLVADVATASFVVEVIDDDATVEVVEGSALNTDGS